MNLPPEKLAAWKALGDVAHQAFTDLRNFHLTVSETPEEFQIRVVSDIFVTILNHMLAMAPPNCTTHQLREAIVDVVANLHIMAKEEDFGKYLKGDKEQNAEKSRIVVPRH